MLMGDTPRKGLVLGSASDFSSDLVSRSVCEGAPHGSRLL